MIAFLQSLWDSFFKSSVGIPLGSAVYGEGFSGGKSIGMIRLVSVGRNSKGKEIFVKEDLANDFFRMQATAKTEAGLTLKPSSGFRSMADQIATFETNLPLGIPTAQPGYSNHQSGDAIDIETGMTIDDLKAGKTTPNFRWLNANCHRFGLKRLASEPWHYSRNGK